VGTIVIVAPRWPVLVVWNSLRLRRFAPPADAYATSASYRVW
jgi:hypothetical protein